MRIEFKGKLDILFHPLQPQRYWTRLRIWYWRVWSQKLSWEFVNSRKL